MQVLCHYSLPQFYTTANTISLIYIITEIISIFDWSVLILKIVQFLLSLTLMMLIFIRPRFQIQKSHYIVLAISFFAVSIILPIQQFDYYYLMLIFFQILSLFMLISLILFNKNLIGLVVVFQIYLIGFLIDFLSFIIWIVQDQFSLSRSIAILGSGGIGLITLIMCLLCHFKPQGRLRNELHIIVVFYIFCEFFICCNIIVELINNVSNIYIIGLIILKISNVFLDILIYPFAYFHVPMFQLPKNNIQSEIIQNSNNRNFECNGTSTKESEYELESALKSKSEKHIVVQKQEKNTSNKWIQSLLEIY